MNEHACVNHYGERAGGKGALQGRAFWHRLLLACAAVAFTVCSSLPGEAVNGEPVGGQGVHRTATCTTDFTISCDDRSQAGIVSCHMRRQPNIDEGLAINVCIDGRITTGTSQTLETGVTVRATDFGEFVCGKESDGSNFCVVCDTFKVPAASEGASHCVKIVSNEVLDEPSTCGAFNISADTGGLCLTAEQELEQFFSDPHLGFSIGIDGGDAADPGAGVGAEDGKDLLICGSRSWQCIDDRSVSLATQAQQVQGQQTHALIDTPCCIRLASGSYYCSAKLTPSATCR